MHRLTHNQVSTPWFVDKGNTFLVPFFLLDLGTTLLGAVAAATGNLTAVDTDARFPLFFDDFGITFPGAVIPALVVVEIDACVVDFFLDDL